MTITITIIESEFIPESEITSARWFCWLKVANDAETPPNDVFMLQAGAPDTLAENELQAHFDSNKSRLWFMAESYGLSPTTGESGAIEATGGAKQWYKDNTQAKQLFELEPDDLEQEIDDMIEALFSSASNANKKRIRLLLTSYAFNDRIFARRLNLL